MKKVLNIIFAVVLLFVANTVFAQTPVTEVTPSGYITKPTLAYIFGSTADTMTNADTLTFVYRIKGGSTYDANIKLYSDHVSGTAGGTLIGYNSINGVDYQANGDTITLSSVTADIMDTEVITLSDYNYPYYKLIFLQTGTAVTVPKVYVINREN